MDEIISQSAPAVDLSEQEQIRRDKLAKLREEGCDPYLITRYDRTHTSQQFLDRFEELENQTVCVAGRMMSRRIMGKASFAHLQDNDGAHDLHLIPLDGCVPFDALAAALRGVPVLTMEAAGRVDKPLPGEDGAELSRRLAGLPGAKAGLLRTQGDRVLAYERMDFSAYLNRLHEAGTALAQRIGGDADV